MSKRPIVVEPAKVLRMRATSVPQEAITSPAIRELTADMRRTLAAAADGVGLAAPQVGASLRIFLVSEEAAAVDTSGQGDELSMHARPPEKNKQWRYEVFINPMLKKQSRKKVHMAEGCLSLPGAFGIIPRAEKVSLEWYDGEGRKHTRGFGRFFARVIQHEFDHLDGVLIRDRAKKLFGVAHDKQ